MSFLSVLEVPVNFRSGIAFCPSERSILRSHRHSLARRPSAMANQKDMPDVYRNLDVVVLTSLWEGLPCVFSEAMACELPIVATNVDGAREAIRDGENGYLHEPHDVEGMAESVLKLIADAELRNTMGSRGKSRVMEFDIETSVAAVESVYRQYLESRDVHRKHKLLRRHTEA